MSIDIRIGSWSKRHNSTSRPATGWGVSYPCTLKDPTSAESPTVELAADQNMMLPSVNYAVLPSIGRYYYIEKRTWNRGLWSISLATDVLATYREAIGSHRGYVVRSSVEYDETLIDSAYPSTVAETDTLLASAQLWTDHTGVPYSGGSYIVGVLNGTASGTRLPITYYALNSSQYSALRLAMMPTAGNLWSQINSYTASDVMRTILDPMQYLVSTYWIPFALPEGATGSSERIYFGAWDSGVDAAPLRAATVTHTVTTAIPSLSPLWTNARPYSSIEAVVNPWGVYELDGREVAGKTLTWQSETSLITGESRLTCAAGSHMTAPNYINVTGQVGSPVQIGQQQTNILGGIGKLAGTVAGAASGMAPVALAGLAVSSVLDLVPHARSTGSAGTALHNPGAIYITRQTYARAAYAPEIGRPLYQSRTISSLGGWLQLQSGDIVMTGSAADRAAVKSALETGIWYE